jgi:hypothetical protein
MSVSRVIFYLLQLIRQRSWGRSSAPRPPPPLPSCLTRRRAGGIGGPGAQVLHGPGPASSVSRHTTRFNTHTRACRGRRWPVRMRESRRPLALPDILLTPVHPGTPRYTPVHPGTPRYTPFTPVHPHAAGVAGAAGPSVWRRPPGCPARLSLWPLPPRPAGVVGAAGRGPRTPQRPGGACSEPRLLSGPCLFSSPRPCPAPGRKKVLDHYEPPTGSC